MFSTIDWHNKSALSIVAVDNNIIDILMVTWYDDKGYDFIENLGYTDALKFNSSYMPDGKKSFFSTEEGRATPIKEGDNTRSHLEYNLKDHFVNTRVVFGGSMIPGGVDIMPISSYYPFEMVMAQKQYNTAGTNYQQNKYLYNGKELRKGGDNPIRTHVLSSEDNGVAYPLNRDDEMDYMGDNWKFAIWGSYMGMAIDISNPGSLKGASPKKFSPNFGRSAKSKASSGSAMSSGSAAASNSVSLKASAKSGGARSNSWNSFLKANKGNFTGKNWQKAATKAYYNSPYYKK
ncbi:hypothetical protein [Saccharicrinis fermentans]|uniref:Uncharacterized protein n=1 Tax=Saccharicrinis fermentans DSM 9555 = JCM 21142 TaxID=869213 RepID=W7Y5H8_9BACT|nr:hypothetical protein [Saccharicrinis fermentans]GAF03352.1 hypothetical protein JCM21142_42020 [Saccharicrinis fermentans DSM 9555 = JCM 21142]